MLTSFMGVGGGHDVRSMSKEASATALRTALLQCAKAEGALFSSFIFTCFAAALASDFELGLFLRLLIRCR